MSEVEAKRPSSWARGLFATVVGALGLQGALVVLIAIAAILATVIAYLLGAPTDTTFGGSIFASWIAGVLFFAVAGAAVTIITIFPLTRASYDTRARILFRGQNGTHINYIIERIRQVLEQYAATAERHISILEYDPAERKYLVAIVSTTELRSYIDDMPSSARTYVSVKGCVPPPANGRRPRLSHIRVNNTVIESSTDFETGITKEFVVEIEPGGRAIVEWKTEYWVSSEDDPCSQNAIRYTKRYNLTVENHTALNVPLTASLYGRPVRTLTLGPNAKEVFEEMRDIPGEKRFYRIDLAPVANRP